MNHGAVIFQNVSFSYPSASRPLIVDLSAHFPRGWTGIVGPNGSGKTTILKLAAGELTPHTGHVRSHGRAVYCPQRTDVAPPAFADLIEAADENALRTKRILGVSEDWLRRWDTLSHGERKRAQVAVMLWTRPAVLAVDEPTNHLDEPARELLAGALKAFDGVGLLVSHDRELLDSLCRQCLFVDPPDVVVRPGGYTEGSRYAEAEDDFAKKQYDLAKRATKKLQREANRRRHLASRADARVSKRNLGARDHDAREKIDRARLSGKDGVDGKRLRQVESRLVKARKEQERFKVKKTYETGIWLKGSRSRRRTLFDIPAGRVRLGDNRSLCFFPLVMRPDDRIALTGANGTGKSTLVRLVVNSLNVPVQRLTYLPQEIDLQASKGVINQCRALPGQVLGRVMNVVSRLGSRPERLLESTEPSPGEVRKLLLAVGIARATHLIIMDEPTNHLDLPSIENLEEALSECPGGLLLVSHDKLFLERLTRTAWHVSPSESDKNELELREL